MKRKKETKEGKKTVEKEERIEILEAEWETIVILEMRESVCRMEKNNVTVLEIGELAR